MKVVVVALALLAFTGTAEARPVPEPVKTQLVTAMHSFAEAIPPRQVIVALIDVACPRPAPGRYVCSAPVNYRAVADEGSYEACTVAISGGRRTSTVGNRTCPLEWFD